MLRLPQQSEEEKSTSDKVTGDAEKPTGFLDGKITRRQAIGRMGAVAAGVAVAAIAGGAGYYYISTTKPATSLVYLGDGVDLGQTAITQFKSETGIDINFTSIDFFTLQQKLLATGGS